MTPSICLRTTNIHPVRLSTFPAACFNINPRRRGVKFCIQQELGERLLNFNQLRGRDHRAIVKPICAAGSGVETSVADTDGTVVLPEVEIVVQSQDADKMKLRVDLTGEQTQKAFNIILSKLARSAPPTPGFRRQKGGKTSKVPRNLLINILGKDRVMGFVIREVVTSTVANYAKRENLNVKDNMINTTQTADELKLSFVPGNPFGFDVDIELVNEETETGSTKV